MNISGSVTAGRAIDDTAAGAAINWSGGTIAGTLNNPGQLTINTTAAYAHLAGTLNNTGTIIWTGGTHLVLYFDGGTLNNQSGGTVNSQVDDTFYLNSGSPQINNAGTFEKTAGTGTTSVTVPFSNSGTVQAQSGTLNLGSLSNFSGTTLAGGTYIVSATLSFPGANIQTNAATIVLNGAASQILNSTTSANALANFAANAAGGSFTVQNGRNFTTVGAFGNAGDVAVGSSSTFTVSGNYTQTAGDTDLQGGTLAATGPVSLQGGLLSGSGMVSGNVNNAAVVGPGDSAGTISITGNYTQTSAGTLNIELGGVATGQFDQLLVSGTATLDGTLNVSLINGFTPTPPQSFPVLTFVSRSGDFAAKTGLDLGGGVKLNPTYSSSSLMLAAWAAASQLVVTTQPPGGVTAGDGFGLTVSAEDSYGNVNSTYASSVTIALANNPGGSTLAGTLTATAVGGVATFSNLTLNKAGTGYTLTATSGSLTSATTSGFNVTAAAAASLAFSGFPATATAGTAFNFTVTALDTYNNVATGYRGTIHFTSSDAGATLPADYAFAAGDAGIRSFPATLTTSGAQTITATDTITPSITGYGSTTVSPSNTTSAAFLKKDATTQGNWINTYGTEGYNVIQDAPSYPSYATVSATGQTAHTWAISTTDVRALQNPGGSGRIAATWYSASSFTIDVSLTDGQAHDLELYFLDWDSTARSEQVQISDAASGMVLDTESISSFHGGVYLDWQVSGHVVIKITKIRPVAMRSSAACSSIRHPRRRQPRRRSRGPIRRISSTARH